MGTCERARPAPMRWSAVECARPGNRVDGEDAGREARPGRVLLQEGCPERFHGVAFHEVDRAAATPRARHPGRRDAANCARDLDERVELRGADLVVVPERGMAGGEERYHRREVPESRAASVSPTRTFSVSTWRQRRNVESSTSEAIRGSIAGVTSRNETIVGSCRASAATAASHCARRALYWLAERLRGDPEWSATRVCVANGRATSRCSSERQSSRMAAPSAPQALANWSIRPQLTPTWTFSARWHIRAS